VPRRRNILIPNRGWWSPLTLFRQIHLEKKTDYKLGQVGLNKPFQASPPRRMKTDFKPSHCLVRGPLTKG